MPRALSCLLAGLLVALAGCRPGEPVVHHLILSGSRCMEPLLTDVAERFQSRHLDVRVHIEPSSAERAVSDTRQGLADVGLLDRAQKADEIDLLGFAFARDGIAFVVHRSNPVPGLSEAQAAALLTRASASWRDVGGSDRKVILVGEGEGRAVRDVLLAHFGLQPGQIRPDLPVTTCEQVLQAVAHQPAALGYVSLGAVESHHGLPVRAVPLGGVPATLESVRAGRYPLVRPLVLLCRKPAGERVQQFIDFARSVEVHDLVQKHGFVPN